MTQSSKWFNPGGGIRPELLNEEAEKIARSFLKKDDRGKQVGVTSSQLRRYFGEVKSLERQVVKPKVKMLRAKVAYGVGRDIKNSYRLESQYTNLQEYLSDCIQDIEEKNEFLAFAQQFEAVVGFYYGLSKGRV